MKGCFSVPLAGRPFSEVLARVAYRLIVQEYRRLSASGPTREEVLLAVDERLGALGLRALQTYVWAFAWNAEQHGVTLRQAALFVVERARSAERLRQRGRPWGRALPRCPRVTNRGAAFPQHDEARRASREGPRCTETSPTTR